ncbi:hypothetical protein KSF_076330 [Reticulibacter mediterranei]|uniref:Transposase n=1 Tax=Reticulibacter mediterranei TaxID=2778369 RepID=A0A8J3N6M8_9CHLR|nr:hypothetical protein KSF_076330 [Reticulibacter mediterranei]
MKIRTIAPDYKGHRFPPEIISHAVWLYFRFSLSIRSVEELLAQRGIVVTYETVRQWCLKFGQTYANELRRRRPRCSDTWHLDEVFLTISGRSTICGERWIKTAMCLTSWSRVAANRESRQTIFPQAPQRVVLQKIISSSKWLM